jgi:hypothetical protein
MQTSAFRRFATYNHCADPNDRWSADWEDDAGRFGYVDWQIVAQTTLQSVNRADSCYFENIWENRNKSTNLFCERQVLKSARNSTFDNLVECHCELE